jgi:hypothetical protein
MCHNNPQTKEAQQKKSKTAKLKNTSSTANQ